MTKEIKLEKNILNLLEVGKNNVLKVGMRKHIECWKKVISLTNNLRYSGVKLSTLRKDILKPISE